MGRLIRAYRRHPWHGRLLAQEAVADWLGTTQPRLSRIENGARTEHLDLLTRWATVLDVPQQLLWFALPGKHGPPGGDLAAVSQERSGALADQVAGGGRIAYLPDDSALSAVRAFACSTSRVCLVVGPPGVGKTTLALRLVEHVGDVADVQVHPVGDWLDERDGLAVEILRYGRAVVEDDAMTEVEREAAFLDRPCLVVLDGVTSQHTWDRVASAIDRLLRHVLTGHLRFVVLARTPPDLDVTRAPLVAASLHGPGPEPGPAYRMTAWTPSQAERVWDRLAGSDGRFADLPEVVRHLARSPLSMRMMVDAGSRTSGSTFDLLGSFVRGALRGASDGVRETVLRAATGHLADVVEAVADLGLPTPAPGTAGAPPVLHDPTGRAAFVHDVVAEYVLASAVVDRICDAGSTTSVVGTLNRLAGAAESSASARGVLGFVIDGLARRAAGLLRSALTGPGSDQRIMVPAVLTHAAAGELRVLTDDVLATCARRCDRPESARAVLAVQRLPAAIGDEIGAWTIDLLRRFGSALWPAAAAAVDRCGDPSVARAVIAAADLGRSADALFLARHLPLFAAPDLRDPTVATLVGHADWRVRAALAEGIADTAGPGTADVVAALVRDQDYKVRAAVAGTVGRVERSVRDRALETLLRDEVWHVRAVTLLGLVGRAPDRRLTDVVRDVLRSERSWGSAPLHASSALARVAVHLDAPDLLEGRPDAAVDRAVFPLLRAHRTGAIAAATTTLDRARDIGGRSTSWVVRRESRADAPTLLDAEWFRRLRGRRRLQVALDLQDLDHAVQVAVAAVAAGAHLVEVGDPLIKQVGLGAISAIKEAVPDVPVVAEMMSADWGRDQVETAALAGADAVLLIGLASTTSIALAVGAGRRLGMPILLDVPSGVLDREWVREVERAGVDTLVVTTNIDHGSRGDDPLERARLLRSWSCLPVAVSGGFSLHDRDILGADHWDIAIVGRSVAESTSPAAATRGLLNAIGTGTLS